MGRVTLQDHLLAGEPTGSRATPTLPFQPERELVGSAILEDLFPPEREFISPTLYRRFPAGHRIGA